MSVFANAGQDCCARSRVFVEASAYDEFVDRFVAATKAIVVGDPADQKTQVGPLVSKQQRDTVEGFLRRLHPRLRRRPAARIGLLPLAHRRRRLRHEPPRLARGSLRPRRVHPTFTDEEQMIAEVNDSPYGLSGSLWTRDLSRAIRVARRVESGVLSINSNSSVHVEAPFGGFKQSGIGRDLGMTALEGYTELKNIFIGE
jgi:acyl-CoA reductase-like NAD-dependent aldehyde dehydrogenase